MTPLSLMLSCASLPVVFRFAMEMRGPNHLDFPFILYIHVTIGMVHVPST